MAKRSLYGGWPLINDRLTCPKCMGTDITLTTRSLGRGTGHGGSYRLGDRAVDVAICSCGAEGVHRGEPPDLRYSVEKEYCGYADPRWVVRFDGGWVGCAVEKLDALNLSHDHHVAFVGGR